ncbi:hypothetical protein O23A_p0538 [Aeromonas salmonicida]|nr:hypothetical protein O23A_p0538 [Aeromonas salmonicida]
MTVIGGRWSLMQKKDGGLYLMSRKEEEYGWVFFNLLFQ